MTPRTALVLAAALLAPLAAVRAQVGTTTDIITGVVTGPDGTPIANAVVEALSLETQITRRARTDSRGRYTILFPDGGGQYRMTARSIGMVPRQETIQRQADEDRLIWDPRLTPGAVELEAVTVRAAPTPVVAPDRPTPGSTERALVPEQIARLPLDATDVTLLATLVPGVLPLAGTDSSAAAFSVAGLRPDANALTLDGLLFGTSSVPQDALRQTRVITSTYDVSRGQFSGGLIAATTRGGTNVLTGSSNYQLRDDDLAVTNEDSPFAQGFTQNVLSGGLGGPIVRDRLFVFGSLQARLRSDPQQTLLSAEATDFTRLGVHPDSVARFVTIVQGLTVLPAILPDPATTRASDNLSGLLRLDYLISNAHTLTLRGDWRGTSQDPARLGALALPQTGGTLATSGGGGMATLASRFGTQVINELRAYLSAADNHGDPFSQLPQGRVQVASALPDGAQGLATLVFGGNPAFPSSGQTRSFEATDELSWLPGRGRHRWKLGGAFYVDRATDLVAANSFGVFTYNSLADLAAGVPSSFRRTIATGERVSEALRWGLYAGDVWIVRPPFQLTYGLRLEGSSFAHPPAYNPAVDSVFGRRTDALPAEWHLSPRAGFTWTLGGGPGRRPGPAPWIVRGGAGEFRSPVSSGLVAQALTATGLDAAGSEIFCVGPAVPAPDWSTYVVNPAAIPGQCEAGGGPIPPGFAPLRTVTLFGRDFTAPRAWRASLGVQRGLTQLLRLSLDLSWARGVSQSGFRDLNLVTAPRFTLPDEAGRPVYVNPADITPATGAVRFGGSRLDAAFGSVLEAQSNLASQSEQATLSLGGVLGRGIVLQTSYTWQRARDQATGARGFGFGGGSTAGDPNVAEWAPSDFGRTHAFLTTVTYPFGPAIEVTAIARLNSGAPYTPLVGGDVNGDGARNDRAFVFAPGVGAPAALGMARLLAVATPAVRGCLLDQVGTVAGRNSCTGPWQATLDFQMNWRPALWGLQRRLTVSLVTVNFLRGVDELLHSPANARGWGLAPRPDGTLLVVTGFDTLAQRFVYQVNERFGSTAGSATAFRPPFQIGVQARFTLGPDRARAALDQIRAGRFGAAAAGAPAGGGGPGMAAGPGGGAAFSPADMLGRLENLLPNPAGFVLTLRDSLKLDSAQVAQLEPLRDSLAARTHARVDSVRKAVEHEGPNPDPIRLMAIVRPGFESGREDVLRVLDQVRGILTAEQWAKLPERIRTLPDRRPGRGRTPR